MLKLVNFIEWSNKKENSPKQLSWNTYMFEIQHTFDHFNFIFVMFYSPTVKHLTDTTNRCERTTRLVNIIINNQHQNSYYNILLN